MKLLIDHISRYIFAKILGGEGFDSCNQVLFQASTQFPGGTGGAIEVSVHM